MLLAAELGKIADQDEQAAFRFFFGATKKEGLDVKPHYSWDQFEDGIAPFNGLPVDMIDQFVEDTEIIPNYNRTTSEKAGLVGRVPMLEALEGDFIKNLHRERQTSAVRAIGIHPSLASPLLFARSIAAAYETEFGVDLRPNLYVVYGAYPLTMQYEFKSPSEGKTTAASPVDIGRSLANLAITSPATANAQTHDSGAKRWMKRTRQTFKQQNEQILSEPGNVLIIHPSGRRGQLVEPGLQQEFLPGGRVEYITEVDAPTFVLGVDDRLLVDAHNPASIVNLTADPEPRHLKRRADLVDAMLHSAAISSTPEMRYFIERHAA